MTLRELGQAPGLSVWAAHDLLRAEGVDVARGGRGETLEALPATLDDLGPQGGSAAGR